jgi:hypothetical protein
MMKSRNKSLAIAEIADLVKIALNLKKISSLKSKSKSHFLKISLLNLTKPLAPLCQCPCLCLKAKITLSLAIFSKAIGKVLGQVNLVHHSENSETELSLAN